MKKLSATELRQNLYRILDEVLETGIPAVVNRKGRKILIAAEGAPGKLDRLEHHDVLKGDPEEIVHLDWSGSWSGELS